MTLAETMFSGRHTKVLGVLFLCITLWWLILHIGDAPESQRFLFGAIYGTVTSAYGAYLGFSAMHVWGGWRSVMGKALLFFSFGLLAQFFGQATFSFYNIVLGVYVPYPSIADIGYFGNIPLNIIGVLYLASASGVRVSLRSVWLQVVSVLVPICMVGLSYYFFLREYDFSQTTLLTALLDFGYPIGQSLFVTLAMLTFMLTRNILGGVMRGRILLILIALVLQYIADTNFLYQTITDTWKNGGYGVYLYFVAYLIMAYALAQIRVMYRKIQTS